MRYTPDLATVCIVIGLLPILLWIPQSWLALDASKPHHAFICGFLGGGVNLAVGVAGPTIDMFFIRTPMDRRTIIATKAAAQVVNHTAKIVFYWQATTVLTGLEWGLVALAAPFAIARHQRRPLGAAAADRRQFQGLDPPDRHRHRVFTIWPAAFPC